MERYPFEFTAQIVRYLETIVKAYAKRQQGSPKGSKFVILVVEGVDTYEEGEAIMSYSEENRKLFEEFLKARGTRIRPVWETEYEDGVVINVLDRGQDWLIKYPKKVFFQVGDIEPILKAWRYYNERKKTDVLQPLNYWDSAGVRFDDESRRLTYLKRLHSFQKSRKRTALFGLLWKHREHKYKDKTINSGEAISFSLISSAIGYKKDSQIVSDLKNLDATLRAKHFPLQISLKGKKALLSIKEKV